MNRSLWHLVYGLAWLLALPVLFIVLVSSWDHSNPGISLLHSQVGSIAWVLGFTGIFFSWARIDALEHGKSKRAVLVFTALWPFLLFVAHAAYLLYTRGFRSGLVAVLKFISFMLACGILVFDSRQADQSSHPLALSMSPMPPNPSLHRKCYSGLRPLPHSGELKR
jgi:hypothetical protein